MSLFRMIRFDDARRGFTLVEMLAAMAVTALILAMLFGITQHASSAWRNTRGRIETFQSARAAFEALSRTMGQATLNPYYDYDNVNAPTRYERKSDLHFISGYGLTSAQITHAVFFQTPGGYSDTPAYDEMQDLLNACGYYITFGVDPLRPAFLDTVPNATGSRYRYRLMQFFQPSQELAVYATSGNNWFSDSLASSQPASHQLAENVIALVVLPKLAAGTPITNDNMYTYDSRASGSGTEQANTQHQLPPLVEIVLVTIDEASASRLENGSAAPDFGVGILFQDSSSIESMEADLQTLEITLKNLKVNYRIFRTTVTLEASKWSA